MLRQDPCCPTQSLHKGLPGWYARHCRAEGDPSSLTAHDVQLCVVDSNAVKAIDRGNDNVIGFGRRYLLTPVAKVLVRKMMSWFLENFSSFALDVCGAVLRQGIFTEKMYKMDLLHSSSASETMARSVRKYGRLIAIMVANPTKVCVPTLDVALTWHTHQPSPSAYYRVTTEKTGKFIDHDDKMDEDKPSQTSDWTSKTYQEKYSEVYS